MKEIPVGRGMVTIVDDEDFERVSQFKWMAYRARSKHTKVWHVRRSNFRKQIYLHRFILNPPEGVFIDHINRDGLDNRRCNLRFCTLWENSLNASPRQGTSRFKGVCKRNDNGRFRARIRVRGKLINLGTFVKEEDAARRYDEAAKLYFGEFAYLNNLAA
jgi:hypothetical protein